MIVGSLGLQGLGLGREVGHPTPFLHRGGASQDADSFRHEELEQQGNGLQAPLPPSWPSAYSGAGTPGDAPFALQDLEEEEGATFYWTDRKMSGLLGREIGRTPAPQSLNLDGSLAGGAVGGGSSPFEERGAVANPASAGSGSFAAPPSASSGLFPAGGWAHLLIIENDKLKARLAHLYAARARASWLLACFEGWRDLSLPARAAEAPRERVEGPVRP